MVLWPASAYISLLLTKPAIMKRYLLLLLSCCLSFAGFTQSGSCHVPQFIDSTAACLAIYQPVCGCDGQTYGNDCEALYHHGIAAFVPGECPQIVGPCSATAAVAARFHFDAKSLAFHRQIQGLGDSSTIAIPDSLYQRALKTLISVFQLTNDPARGEVFSFMHLFYGYPYRYPLSIYLAVDTSETWAKNFQSGVFPTGDPVVDNLVSTYQLKARPFITSMSTRTLVVDSPFPLNLFALSKAFSDAAGFKYAEPKPILGDGDRTIIQSWADPMVIDFSFGWGDCPAGCIYRHYWRFSVDDDCQAIFVESWGNPLPAVTTTAPAPIKHFTIFAQPGSPSIGLQVSLSASMPFEVRIWNSLGQLQRRYRYQAAEVDEMLDLGSAAPGLYLIELSAGNVREVRKIIR